MRYYQSPFIDEEIKTLPRFNSYLPSLRTVLEGPADRYRTIPNSFPFECTECTSITRKYYWIFILHSLYSNNILDFSEHLHSSLHSEDQTIALCKLLLLFSRLDRASHCDDKGCSCIWDEKCIDFHSPIIIIALYFHQTKRISQSHSSSAGHSPSENTHWTEPSKELYNIVTCHVTRPVDQILISLPVPVQRTKRLLHLFMIAVDEGEFAARHSGNVTLMHRGFENQTGRWSAVFAIIFSLEQRSKLWICRQVNLQSKQNDCKRALDWTVANYSEKE